MIRGLLVRLRLFCLNGLYLGLAFALTTDGPLTVRLLVETTLVKVCAWCNHLLDDKNNKLPQTADSLPADAVISHGICNEDVKAQREQLAAAKAARGK